MLIARKYTVYYSTVFRFKGKNKKTIIDAVANCQI